MNANDYKKLLEEALDPMKQQLGDIEGRLGGVEGKLDDPDIGLKRLNDRVDANTAAVMELEKTVKGYADSYKINKYNIERVDTRLSKVEDELNIEVPEDLKVPHFTSSSRS